MNYILGSGISSIILKLYDKKNDFKIIGDNLGGQFNEKFQLGPRILKSTEYSDKFIQQFLNYKKIKQYKVGYLIDNKIQNNCGEKHRLIYFQKTRGKNKKLDSSSMNNNESSFSGYNIDNKDINFMIEKINDYIIKDNIKNIYCMILDKN